jgi:hypothetical protein
MSSNAMAATINSIWQEAMDQIDGWGTKATNNCNAIKKREHERAVANGRQNPPPVPVLWHCPTVEEHICGFSSIGGARSVHQGQPVPDRDANPKWHVSNLLGGIVPKSMLSEWVSVFRTP